MVDVLRLTGADIEGRTVKRLADMRYIGQGSEITVTMPSPLTEAGVRAEFEVAYKALFARTPPGAAIQFVAIRLSVTAPMPGTGGKLELPRHSSANAEKGMRPVFFPDENRTIQTRVWDRYALAPGVKIDGPGRVRRGRKHLHRRPQRDRATAGRRFHPGGGKLMSSLEGLVMLFRTASVSLAHVHERARRSRPEEHEYLFVLAMSVLR